MDTTRFSAPLLWEEYTFGKQTYHQLAIKYGVCIKTIQRHLDKSYVEPAVKKSRSVVVLMDTTYWGRNFGVMLFKDAYTGENLLKYYVKTESNELLLKGYLYPFRSRVRHWRIGL